MSNTTFMDKLKIFLGIRQEPPRNDFRNPIWGSDDDDDDGDELYTRHRIEAHLDPTDLHRHITSQMQEMLKSFGSIFDDVKLFFHDDQFHSLSGFGDIPESEGCGGSKSLRDYYLKPGYDNGKSADHMQDTDLDGKISSHEISSLLKQKEDQQKEISPFDGNLLPGRAFCRTVITTSVTKPDGSIETKRFIKNGNEIIEETTTSSGPDNRGPFNSSLDPITSTNHIYNSIFSEFSSHFRNFIF